MNIMLIITCLGLGLSGGLLIGEKLGRGNAEKVFRAGYRAAKTVGKVSQ